jgi:hypothetical protein
MAIIHTIRSEIRGGGSVGAGAWVARITGSCPKFRLNREFVRKERHTSGSGRSGHITFEIELPGIYELRGVGTNDESIARQARHGGGENRFIEITEDGEVIYLSRSAVLDRFPPVAA